jgi:small subunit ribosomal protein S3Ae
VSKRKSRRRTDLAIDKWKNKTWYTVYTPNYFGQVEIAEIPSSDVVVGRTVETTLYDITNDFSQTHIKMFFKIDNVEGTKAQTKFWGHDFTRDYVRSLVRRTTSQIKTILNINVKAPQQTEGSSEAKYKIRITAVVFTQKRIKTSQQKAIRQIMDNVIQEKAKQLNFVEFVQESVLGKIGSEIYNEVNIIVPVRKSEVMKTKIVAEPAAS